MTTTQTRIDQEQEAGGQTFAAVGSLFLAAHDVRRPLDGVL